MIQLIGSQMREIFEADIVYVALLDPQTNLIHFPYQVGEEFDTLRHGEGLTSRIIQTGEPLLLNLDTTATGVGSKSRLDWYTKQFERLGVPRYLSGATVESAFIYVVGGDGKVALDLAKTLYDLAESSGTAIVSTPYHGYWKNLALAITGRMDAHFTALWDHGHIKFWSMKTLGALLFEAGFRDISFIN